MLFHKFATELFEWVAPYNGSSDGIGLLATKEILKTLNKLTARYNIMVGNYDIFAASIMTMCNVWVKTSDRPYTEHQKDDFIRRAALIAKRNQEPVELDFDFFG